jgi:hypothetical protein
VQARDPLCRQDMIDGSDSIAYVIPGRQLQVIKRWNIYRRGALVEGDSHTVHQVSHPAEAPLILVVDQVDRRELR